MPFRRLVRFVAIVILILEAFNAKLGVYGTGLKNVVSRAVAKEPDAWKRDPTTGQPRACKMIEGTVGLATKIFLLGGGGKIKASVGEYCGGRIEPGCSPGKSQQAIDCCEGIQVADGPPGSRAPACGRTRPQTEMNTPGHHGGDSPRFSCSTVPINIVDTVSILVSVDAGSEACKAGRRRGGKQYSRRF